MKSKYQERITLFDLTHKMSMDDHLAINRETSTVGSQCSVEKEFT